MRHDDEETGPVNEAVADADVEVEEGCILCGGTLSMRLVGGSAGSYCRSCHWISRPHVHRHADHVALVHPARLVA